MEEKSRVNMINATFAFIFINPCFLVRTCGIYHLCPISLLLSFYIFVSRSKFVQIHFFVDTTLALSPLTILFL